MAISALEALKLIDRELNHKATDQVPPGWRTAKQFADEVGQFQQHVQVKLNRAVEAGVAESRRFRIITGQSACVREVMHYRLIEPKPKKGKR